MSPLPYICVVNANPDLIHPDRHGTAENWTLGCRCEPCENWHTGVVARYATPAARSRHVTMTPDKIAAAIRMYEANEPVTAIARHLGVVATTVNSHLRAAGIPPRRTPTKMTPDMIATARRMNAQFKSPNTIAKALGVSATTVRNHLKPTNTT